MVKNTIIWIFWFTFAFLLDSILMILTLGLYLWFTPDAKLIASRANKWWIRKSIDMKAEADPKLKSALTELGWYKTH